MTDKELKACFVRAKRKIEKLGAEVQYRAEKVGEGRYQIFVEILDGGTEARSKSQMSCSTSGEEERAVTPDMVYAAEADRKKWEEQARRAKKTFPDLDLNVEMQNPKFCQLIGAGIDVGTAYQVTHIEESAGGSDAKLADKEWQMNTAIRKAERTLDALGKGPVSLCYLKLDEDRMEKYFSPWEREYHNLLSGEEVITVRSAVGRALLYVVDVTATSVLQSMADLWALLAKKF